MYSNYLNVYFFCLSIPVFHLSLSSNLIYISLSRSLSLPIRRIRRGRWLAGPLDGVGGGRKRETIDAVGDGGFVLRSVAGGVGLCFAVWLVGWVSASRFGRWAGLCFTAWPVEWVSCGWWWLASQVMGFFCLLLLDCL